MTDNSTNLENMLTQNEINENVSTLTHEDKPLQKVYSRHEEAKLESAAILLANSR